MNVYMKHFIVVMKHKFFVMQECFKRGLYWQGLVHDLSKFSPTEFIISAKYFNGKCSPIIQARIDHGYSIAWLHHKAHNKHHWDYWVDFTRGHAIPCPIPDKYIREMACDMIGASKAYTGTSSAHDYFVNNHYHWIMRQEDKDKLERLIKDD